MAHSDFSWRKILSFIGAAVLVLIAFVALAIGGHCFYANQIFYSLMAVLSGCASLTLAVILYRNYQRREQKKDNQN